MIDNLDATAMTIGQENLEERVVGEESMTSVCPLSYHGILPELEPA